jgi:hypothetical protein
MDECDVELISEQEFNSLIASKCPRVTQYQLFEAVVQVKKYPPASPLDNWECTCYPKPAVQKDYEQEYLLTDEKPSVTLTNPEKVEIPIDSQPCPVLPLTDLASTPAASCQAPDVTVYEVSHTPLTDSPTSCYPSNTLLAQESAPVNPLCASLESVTYHLDDQPETVLPCLKYHTKTRMSSPYVPVYEVSHTPLTIHNPHATLPKISHPPPVVKGVCDTKKSVTEGLDRPTALGYNHARTRTIMKYTLPQKSRMSRGYVTLKKVSHRGLTDPKSRGIPQARHCYIRYHKNLVCQGVDKKDFCGTISHLSAYPPPC